MNVNKETLHLFLLVLMDVFAHAMVFPIVPFAAVSLGGQTYEAGIVMAAHAFAQLLFSPLIVRISDGFGRIPVIMLCIGVQCATCLGLSMATSFGQVLTYRVIAGVFNANIELAHAFVKDATEVENRGKGIMLIAMAFSSGFIGGAACGGVLSLWGREFVFHAASVVNLASFLLVYTRLPEPLPFSSREQRGSYFATIPLRTLFTAFTHPSTSMLCIVRMLFSTSLGLVESFIGIYCADMLGISAGRTSWTIAILMGFFSCVQLIFAWQLGYQFRDARLMVVCFTLMSLAFYLWSTAQSYLSVLLFVAIMGLAAGTMNGVTLMAVSKYVTPDASDTHAISMISFVTCCGLISRVCAPLLASWLYVLNGPAYLPLGGMALTAVGALLARLFLYNLNLSPSPPRN